MIASFPRMVFLLSPLSASPLHCSLLVATILSIGCTSPSGFAEEDSDRADETASQTFDERIDARPEIRGYQIELDRLDAGADDATYYFEVSLRGHLSLDNPKFDESCARYGVGECEVDMPTPPTATDNCSGTITAVPDITFPITENGTLITWSFTDESGNSE